eukprot:CAMPEP_0119511440 /NCGR_PEP_ID=MMETSP1344-20130328/30100_1 /TAXON_ID=236787 /ORGANISM="Florenciella parvula, Strain CCMP2471" /LENGTH=551 /DNA_ID=CAMNT_0007548445 /DNA_START=113 /DNA_END=1765 /DNA_ORIENTATION=-
MPPKKKDKKEKKKAEEEDEEENEETILAGTLHELEEEIRGQRATMKVLTIENNKKLREIAACEAEIQAEADRHRQEVDLLKEEKAHAEQLLEHDIFTVGCETKFLQHGLENYDKMIDENAELEKQKMAMEELREKEGMRHALEIHRIKKEMIELRQQIELTFRKALMETDRLFQQKAFTSLDDEAKNSLLANAKLKEEIALQAMGHKNLNQRYEKQEEEIGELTVEIKTLNDAAEGHHQKVAGLKRSLSSYESRMADMELALQRLAAEKERREEAAAKVAARKDGAPATLALVQLEVAKAHTSLLADQAEWEKWRSRAQMLRAFARKRQQGLVEAAEQGEEAAAIMRLTGGAGVGGMLSSEGGDIDGIDGGPSGADPMGELGELESFKSILEMWSLEDDDMASIASVTTRGSSAVPNLEGAAMASAGAGADAGDTTAVLGIVGGSEPPGSTSQRRSVMLAAAAPDSPATAHAKRILDGQDSPNKRLSQVQLHQSLAGSVAIMKQFGAGGDNDGEEDGEGGGTVGDESPDGSEVKVGAPAAWWENPDGPGAG